MAKSDAKMTDPREADREPHDPPESLGAGPSDLADARPIAKGAVAAQKAKTYPLIVRDHAGEMVLSFPTQEARRIAQFELVKRVTGLEPFECSRGKYFPISGQICGVIIPHDDGK